MSVGSGRPHLLVLQRDSVLHIHGKTGYVYTLLTLTKYITQESCPRARARRLPKCSPTHVREEFPSKQTWTYIPLCHVQTHAYCYSATYKYARHFYTHKHSHTHTHTRTQISHRHCCAVAAVVCLTVVTVPHYSVQFQSNLGRVPHYSELLFDDWLIHHHC